MLGKMGPYVRPVLFNSIALPFIWATWQKIQSGDVPTALVSMGAVALFALLGNLERFKALEIGVQGIKAETREVIREARDTIKELRALGLGLGSVAIELIHSDGRFGGASTPNIRDKREQEVVNVLKQLGANEDEVAEALAASARLHRIDYVSMIVERISRELPTSKNEEWKTFWSPWHDKIDRPLPDELSGFISRMTTLLPYEIDLMEDYRHFCKTGQHRRPEIWRQRGTRPWAKQQALPTA